MSTARADRQSPGNAAARLFAFGALSELPPHVLDALRRRTESSDAGLAQQVATIIDQVRTNGDDALRTFAREFDGAELSALEVPGDGLQRAWDTLDPELRASLERAARNIEAVHREWMPRAVEYEVVPGVVLGRRPDPLARAGVYAPGGTAAYPSSVLMGAIPARVAGVTEIVLCSPPGTNGSPSQVVLAAAARAGVDRVFALGGAGAIAALAFGTETVPEVDCIVGPGNAWVAEAKRQVSERVRIDAPAGPSELLVIAESDADMDAIAREMLAQAEHDERAVAIAVIVGAAAAARSAATRLADVMFEQVVRAPRASIMDAALRTRGAITWCETEDEALAFSADFAPEHALLAMQNAERLLPRMRHAGTVFVGTEVSVTFGDYITGANHTLPTGGRARHDSGLSTDDFVRWTTWQQVTREGAHSLAADAARIAEAEGLYAHADAAKARG